MLGHRLGREAEPLQEVRGRHQRIDQRLLSKNCPLALLRLLLLGGSRKQLGHFAFAAQRRVSNPVFVSAQTRSVLSVSELVERLQFGTAT